MSRKILNTQYSILNTKPVYAVILVGGKGKRLRPLSTTARPKAFLSITRDRKTMFRKTLDRIKKIIPPGNILVVANKRHSRLVRKDFPDIKRENLLLEPVSRNTAPAIAYTASALNERSSDAVMVILPADQYITDDTLYLSAIKKAVSFVSDNKDALVVLGIKPSFPSTGFGYVRVKGQGSRGKGIYKVEKFTEKPDLKTARKFLKDSRYLWNAGAFIFGTSAILDNIERFAPRISGVFKNLKTASKAYNRLPDISIDYAVMERADKIHCVRGSYRWHDIGSFEALKTVLKKESRHFVERKGKIVKIK